MRMDWACGIYLGLSQHIHQPTAHQPVRAAGDQVMGVLGSNHLHRVYGVCVTSSRQRSLQDGQVLGSRVPQEDLT